jgi:hypothetical protein
MQTLHIDCNLCEWSGQLKIYQVFMLCFVRFYVYFSFFEASSWAIA